MSKEIYLNLLIFCGILCQGILGSFFEDNHKNSSNLYLRTKRMIGHTVLGNGDWMINDVIHIVKIFKDNVKICAGVIVSPEHILTPTECASNPPEGYRVESGALGISPIKTHQIHRIFDHKLLRLLLIVPPISAESRLSRPIPPAGEALLLGAHPSIIAWGPSGQVRPILQVETSNMMECAVDYMHHNYRITQNHICTVPSNEEHRICRKEDVGSALVVGDRIYGVLDRSGSFENAHHDASILVNNGNEYYTWIMEHIRPYLQEHPHLYNPER